MTTDRNRAIEIIDSLKPHLTEKDYAALKSLSVVPVDTISIKRKVVQGARHTLSAACGFIMREDHKKHGDCTKIHGAGHQMIIDTLEKTIASLDAVLSEWE